MKIIDKINGSDRIIYYFFILIIVLVVNGVLADVFKHTSTIVFKLLIYLTGEILSLKLMLRLIDELEPVFEKKNQYFPAIKMKIMISLLSVSLIAKNIPEMIYFLN